MLARHLDFDVGSAFNEGGDGGVIEVAFAIGDERGEHLLHLRGERQKDVIGLRGLEGIAQIFLVKIDFETGLEIARDEHGAFGVEDGAASEAGFDGVDDDFRIEAAARGQCQRLAHGGDVARDHDLIGELGGVASADGAGEGDAGAEAF